LLTVAVGVAAAAPSKRVLILHSFGPDFGDLYAEERRAELDRQLPGQLELYESWLVSARFTSSEEDAAFLNYLRAEFADHPLDLVIAVGAPAANFLQKYRERLFPLTPLLLTDVEQRRVSDLTANDASVAISVKFQFIVQQILRLLPQTTTLAVVIGNSPIERYWVGQIRETLQPFESRLHLVFLDEMPFDAVLQRVGTLPPGSAIFYVLLSPNVQGIPPDEEESLAKLHAVANAPMFSYTDAYLGKGIVGGPLISGEKLSRETANLAARILRGEHPSDLRVPPLELGTPEYDWRELARWNIKEAALPPGSIIRFRESSVWETYRWQIASAIALILVETTLVVGLFYEHRRRRRAEVEAHHRIAELAHMNRRATMGELSASIAHELYQPLGAILRNTEAAEMILAAPTLDRKELRDALLDIRRDDQRAGEVIRRLRRLLEKAPLEPQEIDLNEMLKEVFEFLSAQASARHIALSAILARQAPRVVGDRIQLQQVILNLVINAMDAIEAAGSGERQIIGRTTVLVGGSLAQVSIEDSGPGIARDKEQQIFEPFFSTKDGGMGMGLSIARTIVESHGGEIWAENEVRGGAMFRFNLPLAKAAATGVAVEAGLNRPRVEPPLETAAARMVRDQP
jgi:signal transduction histidine kinase